MYIKEVPTKLLKGKSKSPRTIFIITICTILTLFIISVNIIGSGKKKPLSSRDTLTKEDIEYNLETEKGIFSQDENIKINLKIKNHSSKKITLNFKSEEQVEFTVEKEINLLIFSLRLIVWKSSFGKTYKKDGTEISLKEKEEKILSALWKQTDSTGQKVSRGNYIISASMKNEKKPVPLQIRVSIK